MIKIEGNDIRRGGEKIGWIEENDMFNEDGKKVGYLKDLVASSRPGVPHPELVAVEEQ